MKRLLVIVLCISLPLSAFANTEIAVFNFVANIDVDEELKTYCVSGASDLVRTQLANYLDVIERKQLNSVLDNWKLEATSGLFDESTVAEIGKLVGAKYSVMGS